MNDSIRSCLLVASAFFLVIAVAAPAAADDLDFLVADSPSPSQDPRSSGAPTPEPTPGSSAGSSSPASPASPTASSPEPADPSAPPSAAASTDPAPAPAPQRRLVEEVIVTAQKSDQNLRDVPISMTVMSGDFLEQQNVTDFNDLTKYVPNARIDAGSAFPDVRIRGFGSPLSNKGFDQSVGLLVDGVPYGRLAYYQIPLYDVQRVEVLRGPQGTLVGKNTTAGVMSVVTRSPADELEGSASVQLGELDRRRFEGVVSGPILPGVVNFRLAAIDENRDGYLKNTTSKIETLAGDRLGLRERRGFRVALGLPDLFGADLVGSFEWAEVDLGSTWNLFRVPEGMKDFYRQYDPDTDFDGTNRKGSLNETGFNTRTLKRFVLNGIYDLPAGWAAGLVGEVSQLDFRAAGDNDFTPIDMFRVDVTDDNPQKTVELRFLSPPDLPGMLGLRSLFGIPLGSSELISGIFFQRRELTDSELAIGLNTSNLAAFVAANSTEGGATPPGDILEALDQAEDEEETTGFFSQRTDSYAIFAHWMWSFFGPFTLEHGMRFTWEQKSAFISNQFTKGTGIAFMALINSQEFAAESEKNSFAFTPKEVLRYDLNDDVGFFASYAKGFKSGGFNELSVNPVNGLTYEPETTSTYEIGTKSRLLGGVGTADVTLFWQDVTDLQVFVVDVDNQIVSVRNAGKARSRGVELDTSWVPTDWLTLTGAAGFLEAKYVEFPFGTCAADREDTDGSGDAFCDLSGQQQTHTPMWTGTVAANVSYPLPRFVDGGLPGGFVQGIKATGNLVVEYNDTQFADQSNDFRMRQPAFVKLNLSLGLADPGDRWSLGITGENLTDEVTRSQTRDVPLGGGNLVQIQEPPRLFFGTFTLRF